MNATQTEQLTVYREQTDKQGDTYIKDKTIPRENLDEARRDGWDVKGNVSHVHNRLLCSDCEENATIGPRHARCLECWEADVRESGFPELVQDEYPEWTTWEDL